MAAGVDPNRVSLLIAMLEKRLGLHLLSTDVYVNVAGGLNVDEPAADLAIVAAIVSSYRNRPVDPGIVILGEVGLAGEVRGISQIHLRLREAASMGFQKVLLPHSSLPKNQAETIQLLDARTVVEAFEALFG
jgi:DNA repair protein RadA/Sms